MHGKSEVKKIFKGTFIVTQGLLFILSMGMMIITATVYFKAHKILNIPPYALIYSIILGCLILASASSGFLSALSKKRIRLQIYILLTLILMNVQVIMAIKSFVIQEKTFDWANERWNDINDTQKNFIQTKFKCCGLSSPSDRPGTECTSEIGCIEVMKNLSKNITSAIQKILIFSFFFESTAMAIISVLKLRR